jgi:predicted Zn-dependent protease
MHELPAAAASAFSEALADYGAGQAAKAAEGFAAVLAAAPDHPDALRLRGLALTRSGRAREALPFLARARRLAWHEPLAHLHHGVGLLEAGEPARAAAVLRRAAMLMPQDPAVWVNFSAALLALGQAAAARAAARRALRAAPELAEAHYAFGLANMACGDLAAARLAFGEAVRLRPAFAAAWLNLGLARYRVGNIGGASAAMRQALEVDPGNAEAEANLAAFMLLTGDTEEALERLRGVLQRAPDCVAARINLANALLLEQEPAEALALLEGEPPRGREGLHWRAHRVLALIETGRRTEATAELDAIAPPYGDAEILILWRRIALTPPEEALPLAERMATVVEDEAMLPEHRIVGHFDLARFHHRRGLKDAAFAHWTSGHRLLSRFQPFSRTAFSEFVDASIACFDAARIAGARADNADEAPVFIVGMPRSGTTLAEHILAAHPLAFGAGERPAVHRLVRSLAGSAETTESVTRLAALDAETLTSAAADFLEELHALAPEAVRVVDKMPANARHLGLLAVLLPGARFIHCRRDPRDIGLSIFQLRFFGHHPYAHDLGDLGFAIGEHERLMAHWRAVLGPRLIDIDLTEWVDDFAGTLDRVLGFLGLPHDPACERFYEQTRPVRTASAAQVRVPINRQGIGRFVSYADHLQPLFDALNQAGLLE